MTEQSTALRLAEYLERGGDFPPTLADAAAELRRLSAENDLLGSAADKLRTLHSAERMELLRQRDQLLKALNAMLRHMGGAEDKWNKITFDQARAAIRAVEE